MKILSAAEIREWDQFTIQHEPISSIDLMERASLAVVKWLLKHYPAATSYGIYCGKGNNGGDGLAIARILHEQHFPVSVHILESVVLNGLAVAATPAHRHTPACSLRLHR